VQKKIVSDCLNGMRQPQVTDWIPRYMAFPSAGYTQRFVSLAPIEFGGEGDDEIDADEADDELADAA